MKKRTWLTALLIAGIVVVATGASFEQAARERIRREQNVPGALVDVGGGRRLQIDCRGSGSPTVVLESGLDALGSLAWAAVHDSIARTTRVCAYSRAGIMWSDAAGGTFDSRNTARDLHVALDVYGESAPWVMVGHSLGAAYIMTFTGQYSAEVGGMVFVDGTHPNQFARLREATGKDLTPSATSARVGAALAWTGLVRALSVAPTMTSWTAAVNSVSPAYFPTSIAALAGEVRAVPATLTRAGGMRALGDRPLVSLTAGLEPQAAELTAMSLDAYQGQRLHAAFQALHDDQASWSSRGRSETVPNATHYIQFDRPDVVIAAVREVVEAVRARRL